VTGHPATAEPAIGRTAAGQTRGSGRARWLARLGLNGGQPSARRLILGYALVSALAWAAGLGAVASSRGTAIERLEEHAATVAGLARGHVKATLDAVDLGLKLLAHRLTTSDWQVLRRRDLAGAEQRAAVNGLLRDMAGAVPTPVTLFMLDAEGQPTAWSGTRPLPAVTFADRAYFRRHRAEPPGGVLVGGLIPPRLVGETTFTLTRRLSLGDGGFAGVAGAAISPRVFDGLFADLDLGAGTTLRVLRGDGTALLSYPEEAPPDADPAPLADLRDHVLRDDATGTVVAVRALPAYGLAVVARAPVTEGLAAWRSSVIWVLAGAFAAYALLTGALLKVVRLMAETAEATAAVQRSETRLRLFFDAAFEGIIIAENGVITDINDAIEAMGGYRAADLVGKPLLVHVHPDDHPRVLEALREERSAPYRVRIRHADGHWFVAEVRGRDHPGQPGVRLTTVRDLTHLLEQEDRLRGLVQDLRRSNEDLEQFAYIASHDLQDPLRTVAGYVGLISHRFGDQLGDEGKEFVGYAVDGVRRMQALIHDLLDYSRVGTREAAPEPCEATELAEAARDALSAAVEASGGQVDIAPLPRVLADRAQMTRVFQNLLSNALKYRHPETPPRVSVTAAPPPGAPEDAPLWRFTVRDNGLGIPRDYAEQVFQIFQRLHGAGEYEGTGIGLAITRRIVERHGGAIWVDTTPAEGDGAVIHFTVPAAP